jgi:hypothetical protein
MKSLIKILPLAILCMTVFSGCVTKPKPVAQKFWDDKNAKVLVVLEELPETGGFFREGSEGLLDMAINSAMLSEEQKYMESYQPLGFQEVGEVFIRELQSRGYMATLYPKQLDLGEYDKPEKKSKDVFYKDISPLFVEHNADYIVILDLQAFGAVRTYYGFIPLADPVGYASVVGNMVDRDGQSIIWYTGFLEGQIKEPVVGEWNQSPNYENLTRALEIAIEQSRKFLRDQFFTGN